MLAAAAILYANSGLEPTRVADALIIITAFVLAPLVNIALVRLALRPLKSLTRVAWLVSQGLLGARVPASIMADRELTQLSHTINKLLDDIVEQRDRLDHASEWCTDVTRR
jgi:nitrogen fixation/metabolism regulation signal transduction histidine kinase